MRKLKADFIVSVSTKHRSTTDIEPKPPKQSELNVENLKVCGNEFNEAGVNCP